MLLLEEGALPAGASFDRSTLAAMQIVGRAIARGDWGGAYLDLKAAGVDWRTAMRLIALEVSWAREDGR